MAKEHMPEKIDLLPMLQLSGRQLLRSWWIGLLLIGLFAGGGYVRASRGYTPSYSVRASFVVSTGSNELVSNAHYDKVTAEQLSQTFPYILTSGALSEIVAADLGLERVPGSISAGALGDTNLFQIKVTGQDPGQIVSVLDSVIENYPQVAKYVIGTTQLKLLEKEPAPDQPDNLPDHKRAMMRSGLIGLFLYLVYLAVCVMTNRTVQSKRMLYRYINISNMGSIPQVKTAKRHRSKPILVSQEEVSRQYLESMNAVRSRLEKKMAKHHMKTLYITSSLAGEGKTTTACNLAILMARHGSKVILIDADLRNPSVAGTLQLQEEEESCLIDILSGKSDPVELPKLLKETEIPNLYVIPGGKPVGKVRDAFTSGRFKSLIGQCREFADLVIVDTPPCAFIHDTAMIAPYLDGGFLVIRRDYAPIDRVVAGTEILARTNAPLIGCALNFSDQHDRKYGYGYK